MKPLGVVGAPTITSFPPSNSPFLPKRFQSRRFSVSCTSPGSRKVEHAKTAASIPQYKPGVFDGLFLNLFRNKLVAVGWDSNKPGYDGLIEVANRLMLNCRTRADAIEAAVPVLRSLFPPFLLELYKMLVAPIGGCKVAAMMVGASTWKKANVPVSASILVNFRHRLSSWIIWEFHRSTANGAQLQ